VRWEENIKPKCYIKSCKTVPCLFSSPRPRHSCRVPPKARGPDDTSNKSSSHADARAGSQRQTSCFVYSLFVSSTFQSRHRRHRLPAGSAPCYAAFLPRRNRALSLMAATLPPLFDT
jgi:hypothetical protein